MSNKKQYTYFVSYAFEGGWGSMSINLKRKKVTQKALEDISEYIKEKEGLEKIVIFTFILLD